MNVIENHYQLVETCSLEENLFLSWKHQAACPPFHKTSSIKLKKYEKYKFLLTNQNTVN